MVHPARALVIASVLVAAPGTSRSAAPAPPPQPVEVHVVDEQGAPLPDVIVGCTKGAHGGDISGTTGIVSLAAGCTKVMCEMSPYAPVTLDVRRRVVTCRMVPGLLVTIEPLPEVCRREGGCYAGLRALVAGQAGRRYVAYASWSPQMSEVAKPRLRFGPVAPGRYRVEVQASGHPWVCGRVLDELPAGPQVISLAWREPREVRGTVLDATGRTRANVPIRVSRLAGAAAAAAADATALESTCERSGSNCEVATDRAGRFAIDVDPAANEMIVAGDEDDPLGTGLANPPAEGAEVTIRLVPRPKS